MRVSEDDLHAACSELCPFVRTVHVAVQVYSDVAG